jgi:hypothetical protein
MPPALPLVPTDPPAPASDSMEPREFASSPQAFVKQAQSRAPKANFKGKGRVFMVGLPDQCLQLEKRTTATDEVRSANDHLKGFVLEA